MVYIIFLHCYLCVVLSPYLHGLVIRSTIFGPNFEIVLKISSLLVMATPAATPSPISTFTHYKQVNKFISKRRSQGKIIEIQKNDIER